ncbi:MAG TPA: polysaccharide biosynthesis C-terminal domain-containing protein [Candidatus Binatus sp.]|jgi:O-antigen/teichoic acid export membrane protein|nr:polysaccharide biosynthesis C-terminal domain-containing protein [Candidatus Binatus sp.]
MWKELKKLLKHSMIYGAGSLFAKAVGFLLIPFYTHHLRPSEYGTLELLDLSMSFISMLINVWVTIPLVRFYNDYEDEEQRRRVVSTTMWIVAVIAASISCLALIFAKGISTAVLKSPDFSYYVQVIAISFFLSCINSVAWNYIRAKQRSILIVSVSFCASIAMIVINILLVGFFKMGVLGILYGSLFGNYVINGLLTVVTLREVGFSFDKHKMKIVAAFGAPLVFANIGAFVLNFSDRFFLQRFSTISVVGTYALGYKFGYMLSFLVIQPFTMIWSARMYDIAKMQDARRLFSRFGAYLCLVLTTVAIGISVVIKDVIGFMAAPDFRSAYRIVPIIALAYVFQGLGYHFQTGMLIEKKSSYLGMAGAIAAVFNIAMNFLLIPRFKGMGAAWATALSFLLLAMLVYSFSQKMYPIPYKLSKFATPLGLGIVAYFISTLITLPTPALSIAVKLLLVPAFWAALYLLGFFDEDEIAKAKSLFNTLLARYRWGAAMSSGG